MTAGGPTLTARHTALGTILTTGQGFTVYAFEADKGTRSACFGTCGGLAPGDHHQHPYHGRRRAGKEVSGG
jgi:predicted lipoprotein with Yx(FWY)xxD motif